MTKDSQSNADEPTPDQCSALLAHIHHEMQQVQKISAAPGSPMNFDDKFLRQFDSTMHQLVINRLLSALDHLQLTVHSLQTFESGLIFPQYSLLRAALAGASTAHWVISGGESVRRERAIKLTHYDLDQQVQFSKEVVKIRVREGQPNPKIQEASRIISHAPKLFDDMYRAYCSLLVARNKTKLPGPEKYGELYETQIIEEMGRNLRKLKKIPNEFELVVQYRLMSGFVHNCIWATHTGAHVRYYQGETSPMVEITGNPVNIYRGAGTAVNVVRIARERAEELAAKTVGNHGEVT